MNKSISHLRTFFRVSNAAFNFKNDIEIAFNGVVTPNKMHELHKRALHELEKENPDLEVVDSLLKEMEDEAESASKKHLNFKKGGVHSDREEILIAQKTQTNDKN